MICKKTSAVLITGASSGIGAAAAKQLALNGFQVFAGVRHPEHINGSENLIQVQLDVTDPEIINRAVETITEILNKDGVMLAGVVNNATVEYHGPVEILPMKFFRHEMEVNYFGTVMVTKAFLPLLRQSRGRIVNMSSISGRCVFKSIGSNCAAKYAIEAFSDALRLELAPWGMQVSIIEPGGVATPLWKKSLQAFEDLPKHIPQEHLQLYYPFWEKSVQAARADEEEHFQKTMPVDRVVKTLIHALTSKKPKTRYLVGRFAKTVALLKWLLPDRLFDRFAVTEFQEQSE
ncbi:MAG: SDR family NAD(P)-dependent oxidoreductase [Desulfamplus sp.]|nr:SDR family NAD(P)-dependent oxidoreductase [Desulfamplus sp.]